MKFADTLYRQIGIYLPIHLFSTNQNLGFDLFVGLGLSSASPTDQPSRQVFSKPSIALASKAKLLASLFR